MKTILIAVYGESEHSRATEDLQRIYDNGTTTACCILDDEDMLLKDAFLKLVEFLAPGHDLEDMGMNVQVTVKKKGWWPW